MKLQNFHQIEGYDEYDVILVKNFKIFGLASDVAIEEIKYLNENGVKVVAADDENYTQLLA